MTVLPLTVGYKGQCMERSLFPQNPWEFWSHWHRADCSVPLKFFPQLNTSWGPCLSGNIWRLLPKSRLPVDVCMLGIVHWQQRFSRNLVFLLFSPDFALFHYAWESFHFYQWKCVIQSVPPLVTFPKSWEVCGVFKKTIWFYFHI